jgi:hypothetical protein
MDSAPDHAGVSAQPAHAGDLADPAQPALRERLLLALARVGLPAWFILNDVLEVARVGSFGIDARHYQRATNEWLAGGDPWKVTEAGFPYAASPHTLLFYAPTSLLPLSVAVAFWMLLGLAAAVWLTRRLGVPIWWVAFPPLAHAIWNGNPQTIVLALLILGGPVASTLAVGLKLYAVGALITRPRLLAIAAIALVVTLPLLPWRMYIDDGLGVGIHLATAWNGSAWRFPILLLPPTLLGLWILRRDGAEWYAVPAAWPATQFYYVSMVLPAVIRRPILAAILATPIPLLAPLVVIGLAARKVWDARRATGWPASRVAEPLPPQ